VNPNFRGNKIYIHWFLIPWIPNLQRKNNIKIYGNCIDVIK